MSLVVKQFHVSNTPREDGCYAEIVARDSGLVAWLLALLKWDATFSLRVFYDKVTYESSALHGFTRVILPVQSVSSVFFGTYRPWKKALGWFLLFSLVASSTAQIGSKGLTAGLVLVGVVVAILILVLNKELSIGVTELTALRYQLHFKRSVIEGQEVSEDQLAQISAIFTAILDAHKPALHRTGDSEGRP